MAFVKCALLFVALFAMAAASPVPEPGFFGPKHEHVVIHVPYNVHTVHHHHVHKVSVPIVKEVIKEVPVLVVIQQLNWSDEASLNLLNSKCGQ
ncbi:hypothetical protein CBL_11269 [Carabus blaptoides fortunei]